MWRALFALATGGRAENGRPECCCAAAKRLCLGGLLSLGWRCPLIAGFITMTGIE